MGKLRTQNLCPGDILSWGEFLVFEVHLNINWFHKCVGILVLMEFETIIFLSYEWKLYQSLRDLIMNISILFLSFYLGNVIEPLILPY